MAALKELGNNSAINLKKVDKRTTALIMNTSNKIQKVEVQLEIREHYMYKPLQAPMVKTTQTKVNQITSMTRQKYGFLKPSAHLEFTSITRL